MRKSHPNSKRLNNFLLKKLAEANDKSPELESGQNNAIAQVITREITAKPKATTFSEWAKEYEAQFETKGKFSRLAAEKPCIRHFQRFLKHHRYQSITFAEISEVF